MKTAKYANIQDCFKAIKAAVSDDTSFETQLDALKEKRQALSITCGQAWTWLTGHVEQVKAAGYTSATDAVNKTLGEAGANRFFNRVNAYKKDTGAGKGKNAHKTKETPFSRLVKKVKALNVKELTQVIQIAQAALAELDATRQSVRAEKAHNKAQVDRIKVKAARAKAARRAASRRAELRA